MRENVRGRSKCHDDEADRRVDGVKAAGPVNDKSHAPTQSIVAGTVHAEANRGVNRDGKVGDQVL